MTTISHQDLRGFAQALLEAGGFGAGDAAEMADLLVWANLRGIDSHGVLRIPRYIEMLRLGMLDAAAQVTEVSRKGAVCVLDAGKAPGATAMNLAVKEAAALAKAQGLGWCGVRNTSHAGAIGYFVRELAEQGLVGIAMTASKPLMSYFGAKGEALSSNPLAIAAPNSDGNPIILDMSTAAVALGKIMSAKDEGRAIPKGWAVDADGVDTEDPHEAEVLLPMAGAKGSGLSLMIEVLCSLLVGNPNIAPALAGKRGGGFNGLVLAVDPEAFGSAALFGTLVDQLAQAIHKLEPAPGFNAVMLPGERGDQCEAERGAEGIPLAKGTAERLSELAATLGVKVPKALARSAET
ncbi:Ldh family oxidoreductase [Sphingopyxis granuli]|uniref:Ldh family oxidoreductase n=1 Tax=Sphingopyxis granuli TaxID=267128 RepID=UPI001BAECB66|nr:Ldh family oxidoreductase [Sphingopyxis granuli]QUM71004.1 Ldh family oxidoreductase [Sphingopyxis granuli]